MNKFKQFALLFLSQICLIVQGQNDTIVIKDTLSSREFNKILNNQFSNLITGQEINTIGSFASLDIEKSKVSFAPMKVLKNGNIAALNASGGISDGVLEIFRKSELNPNVSLDFQFHFINRKRETKLVFDYFQYQELKNKRTDIKETYSKDSLFIVKKQEYNIIISDSLKLKSLKEKLIKLKETLKEKASRDNNKDNCFRYNNRIDSLDYEISLIDLKSKSIRNKLNAFSEETWELEKLVKIGNKRADELEKLDRNGIDIKGFQFGWVSFGYAVRYDAFKIFNPSLGFSDQIQSEKYVSHKFRIQYSFYRWSDDYFRTLYISGGLSYNLKSNFADMAKTEITDVTDYGVNPNDRTTTKTYIAYSGDFKNDQNEWNAFIDIYSFIFNENLVGLHLSPEVRFIASEKPVLNLTLGLLFPFKDKVKEKSIVNAELYYNMSDIFKSTENSYKLFEQNNIGLRFAFPINFNPNKE